MYAALLTVHVLYIRFFVEAFADRTMNFAEEKKTYLKEWLEYLIVGITIIVVAVPEGLPLAVMISLAFSVKKMLEDQNFVKRLASCEIMGGANNICSDKTGTLTQNKMNVTDIWAGKDIALKTDDNLAGKFKWEQITDNNEKIKKLLQEGLCCNTSGTIEEASATEKAMLLFMDGIGVNIEEKRNEFLPHGFTRFHFTSKRKKMSTILQNVKDNENGYDRRIHMKGASEIVLGNCSKWMNQDGQINELDDGMKQHLLKIIESYAERALRTICLAYKDLKQNEGGPNHDEMHSDQVQHEIEHTGFVCYAILGIKDVIRREVPDAVK
jgi:Ca2+ transporting ATPase